MRGPQNHKPARKRKVLQGDHRQGPDKTTRINLNRGSPARTGNHSMSSQITTSYPAQVRGQWEGMNKSKAAKAAQRRGGRRGQRGDRALILT
jgi:hypothetical protein